MTRNSQLRPIGILGGTFDPIHYGHLRVALELYEDLGLREVRMIPARQPPHRGAPGASAEQRVAMLKAALAGQKALRLDTREMERDGPSYTVDTLRSLRTEVGETPLCLIMGADAFGALDTWHRWREVADGAHLIVAHRPGWAVDTANGPGRELRGRIITDASALFERPAGYVLPWPVTQLAISASKIRDLVASGRTARYLLPERTLKLINSMGLYRDSAGEHASRRIEKGRTGRAG